MKPPERDANGLAIPHDHPEILGEHLVVRRISSIAAAQSIVDLKNGGRRVSSAIFTASSRDSDPYEGLSVDLDPVAQQEGIDLRKLIEAENFLGAVSIRTDAVRS